MKIFLTSAICFLLLIPFFRPDTTKLSGIVIDQETNEGLIAATIEIYQKDKIVSGTTTDIDGRYSVTLEPGEYDVKVSYIGFTTQTFKGVTVKRDTENWLEVKMIAAGETLEEVQVIGYDVPKTESVINCFDFSNKKVDKLPKKEFNRIVEKDNTSMGMTITSEEIKSLPTCDISAMSSTTAGVKSKKRKKSKELSVRGSRSDATSYYLDGVRVASDVPVSKNSVISLAESEALLSKPKDSAPPVIEEVPAEELVKMDDVVTDGSVEPIEYDEEDAAETKTEYDAGLLTAGEWNDLDNWEFWNDKTENPKREEMEKHWEIRMQDRYVVRITNSQYQPVVDVHVQLLSKKGNLIWHAKTDHEGKAELWSNVFEENEKGLEIEATYNGKTETQSLVRTYEEGINHIIFPTNCQPSDKLDICFVVDATSSMSDEINYLKAELRDVISRVQKNNSDLSVRLGSVFYRDQGDAYVTKETPLSAKIGQTDRFIKENYSGGGGDYPEAVHSALEKAVQMDWSKEARARLLFLVLDAPPHGTPEVKQSLKNSMRIAAEKGIKVIPVTASGIKKDTEYLMKFFSMATNGTYVFITDHSGIGNAHIEATAQDYEVEYLNDLLVRLISSFTREMCDAQDRWMGDQDTPMLANAGEAVEFFPNPAQDFIALKLKSGIDNISITDATGKVVRDLGQWQTGSSRVNVSDLAAGNYLLRFVKGDLVITEKLVIIRS